MGNTFSPKLQSDVAVEQPVDMPSILGGLANLGAAVAKSSKSGGPSATEVKSAALQPFASRLEELRNSNLEQGEFIKVARKMARTQLSTTPEYQSDVMGILGSYGITTEVTATTEADAFNAGFNAWMETPEGVNAVVRGSKFTAEGVLDPEATSANVRSAYFDYLSEQTAIEESGRELKLAETDVKTHKALSDTKLQEFMPKWMAQSQATVDGIIALAAGGDARFDSPEEQLLALRQARADALSMYRGKASAAGIHSDVYSEKINEVVKPFDDLIALAEDVRVDNQAVFTAYENAKKMGVDKLLIENFGAWGAHPAFAEEAMRLMANTAIASNQNVMKDFLLGSKEFSTEGFMDGLQFIPGVPVSTKDAVNTPSGEVLNPEVLKTYRKGAEADDKYLSRKIDTSIQLLNGVEDAGKEQESIFRSLGSIYAAASVDERPLGMNYLQQIFNPSSIRNITAASSNGGLGVDIKNTVASFAADQIRRQIGVISALTRDNQALSVTEQDGVLVVLRDGRVLPEAVKETGTVKNLFEAVNSVNFINQSVSRLEGVAEETKPLTKNLMGMQPDASADSIRDFLDQSSTEEPLPITDIEHTSGTSSFGSAVDLIKSFEGFEETAYWDVNAYRTGYGSDTVTRADGSVEKVSKDTVITREDAERDLARRIQEFSGKARNKVGPEVWDNMPGNVTDALTSIAYNYGNVPDRLLKAARSGDWEALAVAVEGLAGDNKGVNKNRRLKEAAVIRGKAQPPRGMGPVFSQKPEPRPEPTGGVTQVAQGGAVDTSPRPQARPEGGTTRPAPEGSQRASEIATREQLRALIDNNFDPEQVFNFTSEDALKAALDSGEVKPGDAVMINGNLVVIGDRIDG